MAIAAYYSRIDWRPEQSELAVANGDAMQLHQRHARWQCRDGEWDFCVISAAPLPELPTAEPSEPLPGAIARCVAWARNYDAWVVLNDAEALGPLPLDHLLGIRLLRIDSPERLRLWDRLLSAGMPVYGLRGRLSIQHRIASARSLHSALGFGAFCCEDGLTLTDWQEDRSGIELVLAEEGSLRTRVVIRDGFEVDPLEGSSVRYQDRGHEGYVRLVVERDGEAGVWTQPRMIAPPPLHGGPA